MSMVINSEVVAALQYQNSKRLRGYVLHSLDLSCGHRAMRLAPPGARFKFTLCKGCGQNRKRKVVVP